MTQFTIYPFGGHEVAVFSERIGYKVFKHLTPQSNLFEHFTEEEAEHFIKSHEYEREYGQDLRSPFSGDHCGSVGDCVIFKATDGTIHAFGVSVRWRLRIDRNFFAYGNGKVFIKRKSPNKAK